MGVLYSFEGVKDSTRRREEREGAKNAKEKINTEIKNSNTKDTKYTKDKA
jgi:hypothetical protein